MRGRRASRSYGRYNCGAKSITADDFTLLEHKAVILSDEEAKAAQEVAKTTGKAIDTLRSAGSALIDSTVATIAVDALGFPLGGDWLHEMRKRNLARMQANTARILEGIATERLTEPSPSILIPLLQAAVDEGRPELQALWAALLANAMVDGGKRVRRDYFEAVRQMEPIDALVLHIISQRPNPNSDEKMAADADVQFIHQHRMQRGISPDDYAIARSKLVKLDCVFERQPVPIPARAVFAGPPQPKEYPPSLTAFGRGLLAACTAPE